jgi:restriction endonuclease S subunit
MKYPRYPAYKDSEVEWIGEIPEHWEVLKLKYIVEKFVGGGTPSTSIENYWDGDIPFVAISDITNSSLISVTEKTITTFGMESKQLSLLNKGTILYSIYASVGKVAQLLVPATTNQAVIGLVNSEVTVLNQYLKFALESFEPFIGFLFSSNTQNNINEEKVKNISIPLPNREMQTKITEFLDHKIYKIDSLDFQLQNMIELLQEKRQAIITHAVTKGLDPNVPMKDSGVEWIGQIPKHWEVRKLKHLSTIEMGQSPPSDDYTDNGKVPFIQGSAEFGNVHPLNIHYCDTAKKFAHANDILLSVRAPVGDLNISDKDYGIGRGLCAIRPNDYYRDFTYLYLNASNNYLLSISSGSTYDSISVDDVGNIPVSIPRSKDEAIKTSSYLTVKIAKIDAFVTKLQNMIDLLNEYRSSLISSAVTGKIDVRNISLNESPESQ